jgi:hypothetical protein
MARILVCGGPQLANRLLTERLVAKLRIDGHDADVCASPADAAHCDGLVALMDAGGSAPVAALATARAVGKPVLALSSTGLAPGLAGLGCTEQLLRSDADLTAGLALEAFLRDRGYDRDELKAIKEAKRKRRGGFERCLVVEATPASASALAHEAGVGATTPTVA